MLLRYPDYYERFQCIAGKCEDTCCAGWEIDIDDESYEAYMQVPGAFGERLRDSIKEYHSEDEDIYENHGFLLRTGKRCPFLNQDNLCDMILELGEQSLCYVCTHTPRNYFEYDHTREISISPSCPEAGRLIFSQKKPVHFLEKESEEEFGFEETVEELERAKIVREVRDAAIFLLQNRVRNGRKRPVEKRLCEFLIFSKRIQELWNLGKGVEIFAFVKKVLDGKTEDSFEKEFAEGMAEKDFDRKGMLYDGFCKRMKLFSEMDSINEDWEHALERLYLLFLEEEAPERYAAAVEKFSTYIREKDREYLYEQFLVYYVFLMLPRALDDGNLWGKAQFIAVSFLMVRDMNIETFYRNMQELTGDDYAENVRFFAKEMEHSGENMEFLEEELLFEEDYQLEKLLFFIHAV